jgi:protein O-mannosyl-transferase
MPAARLDIRHFVAGALLVALIWGVFGQTLGFGFVNYDDPLYVLQNPNVRAGLSWPGVAWAFTHVHSQNWHPLTSISHMLDCQLFGLKAGGPHFVNVLLHTIAALGLFLTLNKMTGSLWCSAFAAALFAIHPLRAESVAWASERKDVLSGVFFMCTLAAYVRYARKRTLLNYLGVFLLFACGLMAKPTLVALPLILLLLDYWPLGRSNFWPLLIEKIPLAALSLGSAVVTFFVQDLALGTTAKLPAGARIANALVSYVEYARQFFWPADLSPFYIHPENRLSILQIGLAFILLLAISAAALWRRRAQPYFFVGWFWYLLMLLPVIGIIQVGLQGHADRYTYLSQIGLCIAVAWTLGDLLARWRVRWPAVVSSAAAVIIALAFLAWRQTSHWRDSESLWRHALALEPNNDVANAGLGGTLFAQGKIDEAIGHYERAIHSRPGNAAAHDGLALALANQQRFDEAVEHWQKSLAILPNNIEALNHLALALVKKGRAPEAIAQWDRALAYEPNDPESTNNLAWVLATSPDSQVRSGPRAVQLAEHAVQMTNDPMRLRTLAAAYAETGQYLAAVATANKALEMAETKGDTTLAENLRYCVDLFFRHAPLRDSSR